jgi:PAS domain-containing protein
LKTCVLLIACDPADTRLVVKALARVGEESLDIESVSTLSSGVERISKGGVLAVILDLEKRDQHGIATFEKLFSAVSDIPILLLSGTETESIARQALERGAQDYILKNHLDEFRLRRVVRGMIERKAAEDVAFRQQQRAEVTLSCTGDAVLTTDTSGQVTELNPAAETLTGWTREEAIGRKLGDVFQVIDSVTRQPAQDPLITGLNPKNSVPVPTKTSPISRRSRTRLISSVNNWGLPRTSFRRRSTRALHRTSPPFGILSTNIRYFSLLPSLGLPLWSP